MPRLWGRNPHTGTPWPVLEMLAPFQGSHVTAPRLPTHDNGAQAARALWDACDELTAVGSQRHKQ
jgi:hypothetical protein